MIPLSRRNYFYYLIKMPRPQIKRKVDAPPLMEGFKPFGIPMAELEVVTLLFEEYEAIRLCDYLGLTHEEASQKMGISRPTLTRIYDSARKSVARAFTEGKALIFEGGNYETKRKWHRCQKCKNLTEYSEKQLSCKVCSKN